MALNPKSSIQENGAEYWYHVGMGVWKESCGALNPADFEI